MAAAATASWTPAAWGGELDSQINSSIEQTDAADEAVGKAQDKEAKKLVVPIPIVDPTLGNGLALAALVTFAAPDGDEDTPRSTFGAAAAYTDTDSWMVGGGLKFYIAEDRYRVTLNTGYGNLNLKYYGVNAGSPFIDNPVDFNVSGALVDGTAQIRIADNLYAGVKARYLKPEIGVDTPIDVLPTLTAEFELAAGGAIMEYDTRDNVWYPASGSRGQLELLHYVGQRALNLTFTTGDASYSLYRSLSERLILAGQIRAADATPDTPFFMLPYVSIRGVPAGQYMNQSVIQLESELRWMFRRKFGAVVFAGVGTAAPSFDELEDGRDVYAFGGGIRYRISEVDRLNLGLDVSYASNDEVAVYFRVAEAF